MNRSINLICGTLVFLAFVGLLDAPASAAPPPGCKIFNVNAKASQPLKNVTLPQHCTIRMSNGRPIPDPDCTPGAFNPTLTLTVLKTKGFTTKCVRDQPTSKKQKEQAYSLYGIERPDQNYGLSQTCELDHLISMNLGGAETLDNIWPLCGPADVSLDNRYFKQKGLVENYLAREVRAGRISLADAQKGIAEDWTRYITSAINACQSGGCK